VPAWGEFFGQLHAEGKADAGVCFERYAADYRWTRKPASSAELCVPVKA
jgi:AraC family transcriptional regulator